MKTERTTPAKLPLLIGVCLSLLPLPALAQVAPTTAPAAEETIVLNPFVVTADSTSGYYASETLSGTQLKSQIRDLANPITVLTEEFMRDIGAVNYQEALEFLPSTREFKGDASDTEGVTNRTGTPYMVRGFRSTTLTNNFFTSRIKVDNYNTETVTQSRGPNSLLFGLGSVGGGLDATAKQGRFNANSYGAEVRFDSEGSKRLSVDANQILIPKKLAVRFAALSSDQRTPRDLQYTRRNSAYLNFTIQPFKNTTINVNAEFGRMEESIPRSYLAYDSVSAWLNSPLTPFNKANRSDNLLITNGGSALTAARNAITGVTQTFNATNYLVYVMNNPEWGVQNWKSKSRGSEIRVNGVNQNQTSISSLTVVPGVNFPLDTMVPGPSEHFDTLYDKYSASLQQKLLERTYLEVAGSYEDVFNEDWLPIARGDYEVFIDPNYYLPTQLASANPDPTKPLNPYFGVPYLEGNATLQRRDTVTKQARATLTHQFDLSGIEPINGFDLGKFSVVAFHYYRSTDSYFSQPEEMTSTSQLTTGVIADTQNQIRRRYYLLPGQPVHFPALDYRTATINQAANPAVPGGVIPAVSSAFLNRLNPVYAPETTKSYAAIGQWELFSQRLILTGGVRQDDISAKNFLFTQDPVTRLFGNRGQGAFSPATESSVKNFNYGVVIRATKWLDVYANTATNTVGAGGTNYNIFNERLENQEGDGYDFGLRGFFWDDKLILKLNYFSNTLLNRVSDPLRDGAIGIEMARQNGYVERYLEGMVLNGFGDKVAGSPRFANYTGNQLWSDVESDKTEGYELEATINPTKQLRLMVNVSYNDSTLNATYKYTRPWFDQYVKPYASDAAIRAPIANPLFNTTRTIGEYIDGMARRLAYHEAQVGGSRIRNNKWNVNVVGSYAFDEGMLKGLRVGGDVRWRDPNTIGFPEVAGGFDTKNPYMGAESLVTSAFASYSWKTRLLDRNTNWSVSLRVRNILDDSETYPNSAVDYGNGVPHYLQRIYVQPRTFELTAGMRF